jgi:PIN domain nuclease of toxin-antitoxin system
MIVLDTHTWVWWVCTPGNLPPRVQEEIDRQLALRSEVFPADRLIVATARVLGAALVTGDTKIRAYAHVRTLW